MSSQDLRRDTAPVGPNDIDSPGIPAEGVVDAAGPTDKLVGGKRSGLWHHLRRIALWRSAWSS
jgi:hypothetical protein